MVAQWLWRSATDPKTETPVCCVVSVHVKEPQMIDINLEPCTAVPLTPTTHIRTFNLTIKK